MGGLFCRARYLLCGIAALAIAFCLAIPCAGFAGETYGFSDVKGNEWFATDGILGYAVDQGLLQGYANGKFGPYDKVTRGQVAVVLHRMAGLPETDSEPFSDVNYSEYYGNAIRWARATGVITGYGTSGRFGPNDPVTREQLMTMLANYVSKVAGESIESSGDSLRQMPDQEKVSDWARANVAWALDSGVISGDTSSGVALVNPQGTALRSQLAKMLGVVHRGLNGIPEQEEQEEQEDLEDPEDQDDSDESEDSNGDKPPESGDSGEEPDDQNTDSGEKPETQLPDEPDNLPGDSPQVPEKPADNDVPTATAQTVLQSYQAGLRDRSYSASYSYRVRGELMAPSVAWSVGSITANANVGSTMADIDGDGTVELLSVSWNGGNLVFKVYEAIGGAAKLAATRTIAMPIEGDGAADVFVANGVRGFFLQYRSNPVPVSDERVWHVTQFLYSNNYISIAREAEAAGVSYYDFSGLKTGMSAMGLSTGSIPTSDEADETGFMTSMYCDKNRNVSLACRMKTSVNQSAADTAIAWPSDRYQESWGGTVALGTFTIGPAK